jgi:single-strand DNA-binding protein
MLNRAVLVGRLTADPELRTTPNGISVTTFRIAVDRPFTSKAGERQTDFITIVAWRSSAEFVCKYFQKGSAIGVDGSIQTREYTDRDGNKRTAFEVVADRLSFVERRSQSGGGSPASMEHSAPAPAYQSGSDDDFSIIDGDDDLPF